MCGASKTSVNCWNTLKSQYHNVAGNGKRDGSKSLGILSHGQSAADPL